MRYVTEEVDRVKALFAQKEARLGRERDDSLQEALAATEDCKRLNEQVTELHGHLRSLKEQLEVRLVFIHLSRSGQSSNELHVWHGTLAKCIVPS